MKNYQFIIFLGVLLFSFTFFISCGEKKMSDEDFSKITQEVISEVMKGDFNKSITNPDDYLKVYQDVLEKVCEKYGYTVSDYEKKAEEIGKNLDFK